jgi:hypothetical protein
MTTILLKFLGQFFADGFFIGWLLAVLIISFLARIFFVGSTAIYIEHAHNYLCPPPPLKENPKLHLFWSQYRYNLLSNR